MSDKTHCTGNKLMLRNVPLALILSAVCAGAAAAQTILLTVDAATGGPGKFAAAEIRQAAVERGMTLAADDAPATANAVQITVNVDASAVSAAAAQCYNIRVERKPGRTTIAVHSTDPVGAMYGGFDVAEAIRTGTFDSLQNSDHAPHIAQRGIKFNIPLDLRTPTYSDPSDAAQANIPEMWSMDFWRAFLDDMARHRFNVLSLWSLHPFPRYPNSRTSRWMMFGVPVLSSTQTSAATATTSCGRKCWLTMKSSSE
jgi:hypothetical protein